LFSDSDEATSVAESVDEIVVVSSGMCFYIYGGRGLYKLIGDEKFS